MPYAQNKKNLFRREWACFWFSLTNLYACQVEIKQTSSSTIQVAKENNSKDNAVNNDADHDGIDDGLDNCPTWNNPNQLDADHDGVGNVCDFKKIVAGRFHNCVIRELDGKLLCWGEKSLKHVFQTPLTDRTGFSDVDIDPESGNTCAVHHGTIECWGYYRRHASYRHTWNTAEVEEPIKGELFVSLSTSHAQVCGLTSTGRILCQRPLLNKRGHVFPSPENQKQPNHKESYVSVNVVNGTMTCGLTSQKRLVCWKQMWCTDLQDLHSQSCRNLDKFYSRIKPDEFFSSLGRSKDLFCAITIHGQVHCWENIHDYRIQNNWKKLSPFQLKQDGYSDERPKPFPVGRDHFCKTTSMGHLLCSKDPDDYKLNIPHQKNTTENKRGEEFSLVSTGIAHACAVTRLGRIICWGSNEKAHTLGPDLSQLTKPLPNESYKKVTSFGDVNIVCGVTTHNRIVCWSLKDPQDISILDKSSIMKRFPKKKYASFKILSASLCALTESGHNYCWLINDKNTTEIPNLSYLPGYNKKEQFEFLTGNSLRTCGITNGKDLLCWEQVTNRQPHDPNREPQVPSFKIVSHSKTKQKRFSSVSLGYYQDCGVTTAGGIECWGREIDPQYPQYKGPVPKLPQAKGCNSQEVFAKINQGFGHICTITNHKKLLCWGNQSTMESIFEINGRVFSALGYESVSIDETSTCAITIYGRIKCWGNLAYLHLDQLDYANLYRFEEEEVFVSVAAGESHVCGVTDYGKLLCWGLGQGGGNFPVPEQAHIY